MIAPYRAALTDKVAGTCLAVTVRCGRRASAAGTGTAASTPTGASPGSPSTRSMAPDPDGFSDHSVGAIRIDGDDGRPIAVLVNFAAHPTILPGITA